jgi:hypothetical protein
LLLALFLESQFIWDLSWKIHCHTYSLFLKWLMKEKKFFALFLQNILLFCRNSKKEKCLFFIISYHFVEIFLCGFHYFTIQEYFALFSILYEFQEIFRVFLYQSSIFIYIPIVPVVHLSSLMIHIYFWWTIRWHLWMTLLLIFYMCIS